MSAAIQSLCGLAHRDAIPVTGQVPTEHLGGAGHSRATGPRAAAHREIWQSSNCTATGPRLCHAISRQRRESSPRSMFRPPHEHGCELVAIGRCSSGMRRRSCHRLARLERFGVSRSLLPPSRASRLFVAPDQAIAASFRVPAPARASTPVATRQAAAPHVARRRTEPALRRHQRALMQGSPAPRVHHHQHRSTAAGNTR